MCVSIAIYTSTVEITCVHIATYTLNNKTLTRAGTDETSLEAFLRTAWKRESSTRREWRR